MSIASNNVSSWITSVRLQADLQLVEIIEKLSLSDEIKNIILYNITNGGKRLRPLLTSALTRDLNSQTDFANNIVNQALSLELLHIASLIHDDLPALDNDDYRRGKLTSHKVFGEGASLLAGDLLVGIAFSLVSDNAELTKILSRAWILLCEGQILDISPKKPSKQEIDSRKTGALFVASAEFAGVLADCDSNISEQLKLFGNLFGETYQAQDDAEDEAQFKDEHNKKKESLLEELNTTVLKIEKITGHKILYSREMIEHVF